MIWEIIASVSAAISVIIAVLTYLVDRKTKKKAETIHAIDHVLDSYYKYKDKKGKEPKKDYNFYVEFLSIVERFATDVNEGVLSRKTAKKRLSIFLTKEYENKMKEIIIQRREQFSRENYYEQIEKLIKYMNYNTKKKG